MALIDTDGCDHLQASLFTTKGWSINPTSVQAGRINGNCMRLSQNVFPNKTLPATYATLIFGFGYRFSMTVGTAFEVVALKSGATLTARIQVSTTGKLQILNSGGTVIATGTTTLNSNTFYYLELKLFVNGASGTCELRLNGASEIASTVGNFGSVNMDNFRVGQNGLSGNADYDDFVVMDTSGSTNNAFIGDVHIDTLYPSADGAHTDWTPSTAGTHFDKVNEKTGTFPDGDTSYVSDATVGHRDSYAFDDLPILAGTIFAVKTNVYARKDDAAVRQIAAVARPVATDRDGATVTLSTSYAVYSEIRETNPDTAAAWTISDVNASEFGVKLVA